MANGKCCIELLRLRHPGGCLFGSVANAIERAGIDSNIAEQIAVDIDELVHENVATEPDITLMRSDL
jgi:hypothetical protein